MKISIFKKNQFITFDLGKNKIIYFIQNLFISYLIYHFRKNKIIYFIQNLLISYFDLYHFRKK